MWISLVDDHAQVHLVLQEVVKSASPEWLPAMLPATPRNFHLAHDAAVAEILRQQADAFHLQISSEDHPDRLGVGFVDHQLPVSGVVAERRCAAHPHALALGCRDLVPDALAGDLTLELGERQQDVQSQAAHGGGRIELLRHRHEGGSMAIQNLDDLGEVGERPCQSIDLVDHDSVDQALLKV